MRFRLFLLITTVFLVSCIETEEPDVASLGYEYFPLETGAYNIYEVTQIEYSYGEPNDTTTFQLQVIVGESNLSAGEESFSLLRYVRDINQQEWQLDSVWTARRNSYIAVVVENNVPVIKLSFPVEGNLRWDGNSLNTNPYDEFKLVNVELPFTLDNTTYTKTVELVKEEILDTITADNYHKEVFAWGIGMIYRIDIDREYCNNDLCPAGSIEYGRLVEYKLIEFGYVE